jgi:hypothetical protein
MVNTTFPTSSFIESKETPSSLLAVHPMSIASVLETKTLMKSAHRAIGECTKRVPLGIEESNLVVAIVSLARRSSSLITILSPNFI